MLEQFLTKAADLIMSAGVKIVVSILIIIIGFRLIKIVLKFLENGKLSQKLDASFRSFAVNFLSIALKIILLITVASYLGVPMTSVVTVLGSAAVAIGLALQGGLSNIASGIMIVFFRTFSVGDYIENGSYSGTVKQIGLFHTILTTPDNVQVVIPNSQLTSQTVKNYSVEETRRVDVDFTVAYNSDPDKVRNIIMKVASVTEGVMIEPAPVVYMTSHGDSAIVFSLRVWCANSDYWNVKFALLENVKRTFDATGIEIPYPQMDIHVVSND
ncbi:MAG: mechanosensitive ion channel family protein [Clostridia bacterium]|nr:mechanosensitive ion channel family protein [Clostridia bacterium]